MSQSFMESCVPILVSYVQVTAFTHQQLNKKQTKKNKKYLTTEAHKQTHTHISFPLPLPERYRTKQRHCQFPYTLFPKYSVIFHHTLHQTSGHLYKVISFKVFLQGMWNGLERVRMNCIIWYPHNLCVLSFHSQVQRCLQVDILYVHIGLALQQSTNSHCLVTFYAFKSTHLIFISWRNNSKKAKLSHCTDIKWNITYVYIMPDTLKKTCRCVGVGVGGWGVPHPDID